MKKKIIGSVLVLGIVAVAAGLFVPNAVQKITKKSVITSSQLEKAVDISELSTAEFIYNGIADKYSDGNLEETECHIAYASTVKVGIALDQITFTIDEEKKNGNAGTAGDYDKYSNRGSGFAQFYPTESRCGAERYHDGVQGRCPKGSK